MIRRLLYHLGIIDLVWTIDSAAVDSGVRLRTVWHRDGKEYVFGICAPPMFWDTKQHALELLPDGEFGQHREIYIKTWVPYWQKPPRIPKHRVGLWSCLRRRRYE